MEHKITVKIAGRPYSKTIQSEDEEAIIRKAAREVNARIDEFSQGGVYGKISQLDILSVVALNECIDKIESKQLMSGSDEGYEKLSADLQAYVDSLK